MHCRNLFIWVSQSYREEYYEALMPYVVRPFEKAALPCGRSIEKINSELKKQPPRWAELERHHGFVSLRKNGHCGTGRRKNPNLETQTLNPTPRGLADSLSHELHHAYSFLPLALYLLNRTEASLSFDVPLTGEGPRGLLGNRVLLLPALGLIGFRV